MSDYKYLVESAVDADTSSLQFTPNPIPHAPPSTMFALLPQFFVLSASIALVLAVPAATDITVVGPRDVTLPPVVQPEDVIWHTIGVFDSKNGTVIPEEMEAMLNNTRRLEKRQVLPPYQCEPGYRFELVNNSPTLN